MTLYTKLLEWIYFDTYVADIYTYRYLLEASDQLSDSNLDYISKLLNWLE
jgi:hypothetical protein